MKRPRDAAAFSTWWEKKHEDFGATRNGREYCRRGRDPLVKRFYEELLPLAKALPLLAPLMPGLVCQPSLGYEPYDAWIWNEADQKIAIEITFAKNGHIEDLQAQEISRKGWVNTTFPPQIEGQGKHKKVTFREYEMRECEETTAETWGRIHTCLQKKSSKEYPPETILIIYFNDSRVDAEDWPEWIKFFISLDHPFAGLIILGEHFNWMNLSGV